MKTSMRDKITKAQKAIRKGDTRGKFIRENTSKVTSMEELQNWSDAYTLGMPKHKLDIEVHFLLDLDVLNQTL